MEQIKYFKKEASYCDNQELIERYEKIENIIKEIIRKKKDLRQELENTEEKETSLSFIQKNDSITSSLEKELMNIF